ncbi:aminotransferase class I/II-fold pyridoxal phosphate-dependent enzyme, partial [Acidiphilium sp. PM]
IGGAMADRAAGAHWLRDRMGPLPPERVLLCPGAQGALLAIAGLLAAPGDAVCVEDLTYPGFRALAAHRGLRLVPVAMDADGLLPDAFEAACRAHRPKLLYCTPTLHNPTTATMPPDRRAAIAAIATAQGIAIVEDDAYGMLPRSAPPPLATFAPSISYYIAGVAKSLSPALRLAYVVPP